MDPVAHSLFGATLAETGLRHKTRYATGTLIIGANIPDIDGVASFLGRDMSLYLRRGWTHGVLAMVVLPLVLAGLVLGWHRFVRKREGPPPDMRWVVGLAFIATWSHPILDWMNTYGVRLLMPFDGRWFYGDTLFIIDPYFWLLTAAGVVLARSESKKAIVGWSVLGGLSTLLVVAVDMVPIWVKIIWLIGVATILFVRIKKPFQSRTVARFGFTTLLLYICVVFGMARFAESAAVEKGAPIEVQSNPIPGVPFEHRVVVVYEHRYEVIPPHGERFVVEREEPTKVVKAALESDAIKGFANWTRFPYWNVEEQEDGWIVTFRDLRYVDPGEPSRGIGLAKVKVGQNYEVVLLKDR